MTFACQSDAIIGPRSAAPQPLANSRSTNLGETSIRIPQDNGGSTHGSVDWTTTSINLPPNEWVMIQVSGGVELQTNPDCLQQPGCTFPLSGQTINALGIYPDFLRVHVSGSGFADIPLSLNAQSIPGALIWSGTGGVISVKRTGIQDGYGCIGHAPDFYGLTGCPPPDGALAFWYLAAYEMSGTQTISAKLGDPLIVTASPTSIHPGDTVHFTAQLVEPGGGLSSRYWRWVPGEVGNNQQNDLPNAWPDGGINPGCSVGDTCDYAPAQSGRMYAVAGDANAHYAHGSSEYIKINSGKFTVIADPSSVNLGGEILASRTRVRGVSASIHGVANEVESVSVKFTAQTSDQSAITIQSWSYQADNASAGTSTPCAPSVNPCYYDVSQSGTMFVTALVEGTQQLATVHVVVTCPTVGDSVLDAPGMQDSLKAALAQSNPNAEEGTGQRREVGGAIFMRADGSFFTVPAYDPEATECTFNPNIISQAPPSNEPTATIYAIYHTHPSNPYEDVYGCPPNGKEHYAQSKADLPQLKPQKAGQEGAAGGGSLDFDWAWGRGSQLTDYVVTKSGHIYKLDWTIPEHHESSAKHWKFKTDGAGCLK